jgi:hypothetical protein
MHCYDNHLNPTVKGLSATNHAYHPIKCNPRLWQFLPFLFPFSPAASADPLPCTTKLWGHQWRARGCFLAWVCFFLTSGFAIYFFTGTNLVFFSPIPPPCFTSFPLSLIDLSFSIITFICALTLEVAEIDIDAISANTCIDDTSSVNLSYTSARYSLDGV